MDSKTALQELKNFQSTRKSAGDYYTEAQNELGVGAAKTRADDLRGLIRNTETALKGVGDSVAGRTRGQLVTEAQRSRIENLEREPLMEGLSGLSGSYSDEMSSYRDLLGQAGNKAQMSYQTDADRLAALESNYGKLFQAEQAAEERRRFEAQLEESRKQAAASRASQASLFNPSFGAPKAQMGQREGGGFNFVDDKGQAISAARYAQLTGQKLADVLQSMGQSGDQYAAQVYNQLKRDPWIEKNLPQYRQLYSSLFWGT